MNRPIAFNLVRGIFGALQKTPRGIDRIDFGYAGYLLDNWAGDVVGVLPMPYGVRYYSRDVVRRGHNLLGHFWQEQAASHKDAALSRLKAAWIDPNAQQTVDRSAKKPVQLADYWRASRLLFSSGVQFGRPVRRLPQNALYLDIGHYGLGTPRYLDWLKGRPDVSPVFMLHDTIPLEFPEMVADETVRGHDRALATTALYAREIIVPTNAAGRAVRSELARRGRHNISIHAVPLPMEPAFLKPTNLFAEFRSKPYFLICGAIEFRKNIGVLVEAWVDLVARLGDRAPRLVIAGAPGYKSAEILNLIASRTDLREHLFIASGLSTPSIARLMAGARAVLMPSLAEGFGLPPVEALSLGTPAILSDIEAHRDAAGAFGIYVGASDVAGWIARIEAMIDDTDDYLSWKAHVARFRPYDWPRYMAEITDILSHID